MFEAGGGLSVVLATPFMLGVKAGLDLLGLESFALFNKFLLSAPKVKRN